VGSAGFLLFLCALCGKILLSWGGDYPLDLSLSDSYILSNDNRGETMNIGFIKKMIKILEGSNLEEIEFQRFWTRVRISKNTKGSASKVSVTNIKNKEPQELGSKEEIEKEETNLHFIKSPMVGTFYRAPTPDAPPYVDIGDKITKGDVVCIIEAMKIMNEIESDVKGEIVEVLIVNEGPVEFNQPLFKVRKQ
jgi:acetyl-CoA carboxylase biotin carboxyl carrier protein